MSSDLFTDKYFPKSFDEFAGNGPIVTLVKNWAQNWNDGNPGKPLLFHGPPGIGKTCLAYLTAQLYGWDIFELNASDLRNKAALDKVARAAALNASFSGKKRLILLDEVDGLQAVDRGGASAIASIIKETCNPVILTANKIYSAKRKLDPIKPYTEELKFSRVPGPSIAKRLREVSLAEGIDFDMEVLKELAASSEGDLRAALLDLQSLTFNNKITLEDVQSSSYRERKEEIFNILNKVFKGKDVKMIRRAKAASEVDTSLLKRWIEENIPRIYKNGNDTEQAFQQLSKADIFDGRIMRRQYWGFLRYSSELMTSGVALAKENDYHGWLQVQFPSLLKKLSSSKGERQMKKGLAIKMSKPLHSTSRKIIRDDLPFLKIYFQDKELAAFLTDKFDLNDKEVAYLLSTKPTTKKVQKIMENAQHLKDERVKAKRFVEQARPEENDEEPVDVQQTRLNF
jgi:replication factor C large subunit